MLFVVWTSSKDERERKRMFPKKKREFGLIWILGLKDLILFFCFFIMSLEKERKGEGA